MTHPSASEKRRFSTVLLFGILTLACFSPIACADPTTPTAEERNITKGVMSLLQSDHLLRQGGSSFWERLTNAEPKKEMISDEELSRRCLKTYLKMLDPWKVYFYQSDVDAFTVDAKDLYGKAKRGDVGFAHRVFKVFLQRVDERLALIQKLLATEHDFTANEVMISDRDMVRYPRTVAEANDRWRKRIKYDLLVLKADDKEGKEATDKLTRRYNSFAKRMHQTDGDELLEMYLTSMTSGFDPHTSYMSPNTLENFEIAMRLQLEGIGASLQSVDGYTVVKRIIPGGAADIDGRLKAEDKIVGVGQGVDGEMVDTVDMKLTDVVKMIRGKRETLVRLETVSVDSPEHETYNITRAKIELKDSEAQSAIFTDGLKPDGQPYRIGVIELPSFYMDMEGARRGLPNYKSTTRDVRRILDDFTKQGVDAVVLDLRRNGGGSLTESINCTGLFIDQGPVVQVKDGAGNVRPYHDMQQGVAWSGPLVVLISQFSASASEILAGAIQDYHRGLIVGDHATHGKGTVQSLIDLGHRWFQDLPDAPAMGALKVTMQQFYRPNGDSTQNRGVLSDVELPSLTTHLDVGESDLDYPIAFDHVTAQRFDVLGYVTKPICEELRARSTHRCEVSEDFKDVLTNIARYKTQKEKKSITLNEVEFLKERADLNADKAQQKKIEELSDPNKAAIERDYYLDEALAITIDYLGLTSMTKFN